MNKLKKLKRCRTPRRTLLLGSTVDMSNLFYDGIVQELAQRNWQVHVVSSQGIIGNKLFGQHAHIHKLEMRRELAPLRDLNSLLQWLMLFARVRPQILVVGTPKASLLGVLAARVMRTPRVIYVIHGLRSETTQGTMGRILTATEAMTIALAHHVVAVSPSLKMAVEDAHPKQKGRIETLGFGSINGVQLSRFTPVTEMDHLIARKRLDLPEGCFIIGFIGRLHRDKGGDFLLRMMKHERSKSLNLHLVIIGELEDDTLQGEIDELKSEGHVTITGWVDQPENDIASLQLLVHPSRREGLGMVLLEAQASGIPVLTNRVTGTIDAVHDGVGGKFAEMDSISSWLDSIETFVADPVLRRDMGERGREFVKDRYSRDEVVNRFAEFVEDAQ